MKILQPMKTLPLAASIFIVSATCVVGQDQATNTDQQAAYTATITQRAEKIVSSLGLEDVPKAQRVRDVIVQQYRDLNAIHETAKAKPATPPADSVTQPGGKTPGSKPGTDLEKLHTAFVSRLSQELTPGQVDKVKDGMTYGVVQVTYNAYLVMLPELKEEEKAHIMTLLVEARETAMDAGSAEEKHQWFGKYKGRINNYLSAQGYDLKKASRNLEKQKR